MVCVKCGGEVWDNRAKKASGEFSAKGPDFACKDKTGCGWVQWPPKGKAAAAPTIPAAPQAPIVADPVAPSPRDLLIQELFWDSFDAVLAGVKKRVLTDFFTSDDIAALTATLFIQRSKG